MGDVNAGLMLRLKDEKFVRPLVNIYYESGRLKLPDSWGNGGKGGVTVASASDGTVPVSASSGSRMLRAGETLSFIFEIHITPFRTLDTEKQRTGGCHPLLASSDYGTNLADWQNNGSSSALGNRANGSINGSLGSLTSDTIYTTRFYALNTTPDPDEEAWSAPVTFGTPFGTGQKVADLSATAVAYDRMELTWTDSFNTEEEYYLEFSDDGGDNFLFLATLQAVVLGGNLFDNGANPGGGTAMGAFNGTIDRARFSTFTGSPFDPSFLLTAAPAPDFAARINGFSVTDKSFTGDPDRDRLANGLENFLGTDPGAWNAGLTELSFNGNSLTFQHPQNESPASDVTGSYEWSTDLVTWHAGDGSDGPASRNRPRRGGGRGRSLDLALAGACRHLRWPGNRLVPGRRFLFLLEPAQPARNLVAHIIAGRGTPGLPLGDALRNHRHGQARQPRHHPGGGQPHGAHRRMDMGRPLDALPCQLARR